jgi:hypothetical protein
MTNKNHSEPAEIYKLLTGLQADGEMFIIPAN